MKIYVIILSIIVLLALTACSGGGTFEKEEGAVTLKILFANTDYFFDSDDLERKYGHSFRAQYPHIKLEYINADVITGFPTYYERFTLKDEISKHQPDLVVMPPGYFKEVAQSGIFREIPGTDVVNLYSPVVDYVRTLGGSSGPLYGVSDEFFVAAIEYNKKLFDRYKVEYPTDGMTWEELFRLSGKFPRFGDNNAKLYGLYFPWGNETWQGGLIDAMRRTAELSYTEERRFNLQTDEWRQLLSLAMNGYIQGNISPMRDMDLTYFNEDLFREDQAAMTYRYFYKGYFDKGYRYMEEADHIGFVREPGGDSHTASSFRVNCIFAINQQAAHPKEAMDFIRFINSDELVKSNLNRMYGIPARTDLIPESRREALASILQLDVNAENLISRDEYYTVSLGLPLIISFELDKAFKQFMEQKAMLNEVIPQIEKGAQAKLDEYLNTGKLKLLK